jgi:beta-N-acetylhexosaminidase
MKRAARPGRLLVIGFEGTELPKTLLEFARLHGLGGVILFKRNCPDAAAVRAITRAVREALRDPGDGFVPPVFTDQEGGRVERIADGVPHLPSAREMGARGEDEVRRLAAGQARALAALGVDVNLAPVCDVVREGESGVIGDRAFSADPEDAALLARAFYEGMREGGVLGCAKHFPGHGASPVDSHSDPGRLGLSREELERVDLVPFRALVRAGVDLVMANHLSYPAMDGSPAVLSRRWLEGILRGELEFGGAILSDDMEMAAATAEGDPGETALRAVEAGCDLLIYGRMMRPDVDVFGVADRLAASLSAERIAASFARVSKLRERKPA